MRNGISLIVILVTMLFGQFVSARTGRAADGCTARGCHAGISDIVPMSLDMMQLIKKNGQRHGDPDGCVICHGGSPGETKKKKAHRSIPATLLRAAGPKDFYPDPGSIWIARNTCGVCHPGYVYRSRQSLMNTEAGKIQGSLHAWGIEQVQGHRVPWGNYDITDTDGPVPSGASKSYEYYMAMQVRQYPDQYPAALSRIPLPDPDKIESDPKLAGFTYQRQECQRCHLGVRGREMLGEYRGMGCSACHMPYGTDGLYQGDDASISKEEPGHILRHRIAGNRKTGGIQPETCNTCHNGGKRTGVSYLGLMESAFQGPLDKDGNPGPALHGKTYRQIFADLHHQTGSNPAENSKNGLLCQDCHTSMDVHGDGNIHGTTLAQVEIECTDCHGTPEKWPWELPLGHGDEFGREVSKPEMRGVTDEKLLSDRQFGFNHDPREGFLLTARGNPLGNVVRSGDTVIVYSAAGNDFMVPLLKQIKEKTSWKKPAGKIAMSSVSLHLERMECYACHATWVPQSYGRYVRVDYQDKNPSRTDWVASGNSHTENGQTSESSRGSRGILSPGRVEEHPDFLRWEDPVLGVNGEGRISPLMPGSQVVYSVIGKKGSLLAYNQTALNPTQAGDIGQDYIPTAFDMAPAQPHTNQREARTCENCHTCLKAAGLGLEGAARWTRILSEEGIQIATVGTHWPLSRAFNKKETAVFLKTGTCMGCHVNMEDPIFWKKVSEQKLPDSSKHEELMNQVLRRQQFPF